MQLTFDPDTIREFARPIIEEVASALLANPIGGNERLAYTEPEAAELLGIAAHQLRDARLRGEITSTKVGGRIGYERSELIAYLARGRNC